MPVVCISHPRHMHSNITLTFSSFSSINPYALPPKLFGTPSHMQRQVPLYLFLFYRKIGTLIIIKDNIFI